MGYDAPVKITVFNKLNDPLYIDWTKSAFIIDNVAEAYASKDTPFYGGGITETIRTHENRSVSFKEFGGVIENSENVSYVIPQTMVSKQFMNIYLDYKQFENLPYENIQLPNKKGIVRTVEKVNFTQADSPLKFKSFLTLYYTPEKPITHLTEFYQAGLIKTKSISPENLPANMNDKGNIFYHQYTDHTIAYVVSGVVVAAVLIVPFAVHSEPDFENPW